MVAMLMIAMALVFSLQAAGHAERAARMARELQDATALTVALMEEGPRGEGASAGEDRGFAWSLEVRSTGAERPIELCRRAAQLRNPATTRAFTVSSIQICEAAGGGA